MNVTTRDAMLRGVSGAAEAHQAFDSRTKHEDGLRPIDVFDAITDLQIPLAFEALDELLGACVRVSSAEVGILLTNRRDLHMQRFTAAHELGHFVLNHEGSLDRDIRMPGHTQGRDIVEIEADAFAAEFLMPKWLVKAAAKRRQWWTSDSLRNPDVVYQLSLRLGSSYEAMCWSLLAHEFIEQQAAEALVGNGKKPKELKKKILGDVQLQDPRADVWSISEYDDRAFLDAGPNDLFVLSLDEPASTGFRWDLSDAVARGFRLVEDSSVFEDDLIGGPARRRVVLAAPPAGSYELKLALRRSFARASAPPRQELSVSISTLGTRSDAGVAIGAPTSQTLH